MRVLIWLLATIIVLQGCIIFTESGHFVVVEEFGSAADWVAGLGTWVIGYGAWRYARDAHALRRIEVCESQLAQSKVVASRLRSMQYRANNACAAKRQLEEASIDEDGIDTIAVFACAESTLVVFSNLEWTEEEASLLPFNLVAAIGDARVGLQSYITFTRELLDNLKGKVGPRIPLDDIEYVAMKASAEQLHDAAANLRAGVVGELEKVLGRIAAQEAQLRQYMQMP